ncbi:hypothetical protein BD309DRAFT_982372 [Dichomitus squalens]|nr:hypothetical protein BD309DRAFT_982372 [Dichomitus squalens]
MPNNNDVLRWHLYLPHWPGAEGLLLWSIEKQLAAVLGESHVVQRPWVWPSPTQTSQQGVIGNTIINRAGTSTRISLLYAVVRCVSLLFRIGSVSEDMEEDEPHTRSHARDPQHLPRCQVGRADGASPRELRLGRTPESFTHAADVVPAVALDRRWRHTAVDGDSDNRWVIHDVRRRLFARTSRALLCAGYYRQLRGKGASRKLEPDATQTPPLSALHDVSADEVCTGKISERGNDIEAHESYEDMPMSEPLPALDALARARRQTTARG